MTRSTRKRTKKKNTAPKTARESRGAAARPPIVEFLRRLRVQGAINDIGGEVKSLRRELRVGIDRLAKRIERFGRALQTRSGSKR